MVFIDLDVVIDRWMTFMSLVTLVQTFFWSQTICALLQEFLVAVSNESAKVLPALREQLAKLEITVKH